MKTIDPAEGEQLVLKALNKDPAKCSGMHTIHQKIAFNDNIHLTWYPDHFFSANFVFSCFSHVLYQRFCQ